jgi:hypothetical protein
MATKRYFAMLKETPEGREKLRAITAKGGATSHARGTAHRFAAGPEAQEHGRIGGMMRAAKAGAYAAPDDPKEEP